MKSLFTLKAIVKKTIKTRIWLYLPNTKLELGIIFTCVVNAKPSINIRSHHIHVNSIFKTRTCSGLEIITNKKRQPNHNIRRRMQDHAQSALSTLLVCPICLMQIQNQYNSFTFQTLIVGLFLSDQHHGIHDSIPSPFEKVRANMSLNAVYTYQGLKWIIFDHFDLHSFHLPSVQMISSWQMRWKQPTHVRRMFLDRSLHNFRHEASHINMMDKETVCSQDTCQSQCPSILFKNVFRDRLQKYAAWSRYSLYMAKQLRIWSSKISHEVASDKKLHIT